MMTASAKRLLMPLAALALTAVPAAAQYPPNPYYNPYAYPTYSGFGPGATLQGQAAVLNAQGQQNIQLEQARLAREQALQAQIDTKRKAFDEMRYEQENTPTFTEVQEKTEMMRIRRLLNNPTSGEIQNGSAMNTLLPYLQRLMMQGTHGVPVPLDPELLSQVNVTPAGKQSSAGVLRDGGKMNWPFALRGMPAQKELEKLIPEAVAAAASNSLQPDVYFSITKKVEQLGDELSANFRAEKIDGGTYLQGKRFLDNLKDSVRVLSAPNSSDYFNGSYTAKGQNVEELIRYMGQKGLQFAPANPGDAAAYQSVYNAMVAFASAGQGEGGFRMRTNPTQQASLKDK